MNGKTMDERVMDLGKLAESLAPLPVRMAAVEGRLGDVDTRLGTVETRLSTVESRIVQLRTEMHVEFSAVRREMADLGSEIRGDVAAHVVDLTGHIHETQSEMRVLHEAVISRIALIGEGRRPEG